MLAYSNVNLRLFTHLILNVKQNQEKKINRLNRWSEINHLWKSITGNDEELNLHSDLDPIENLSLTLRPAWIGFLSSFLLVGGMPLHFPLSSFVCGTIQMILSLMTFRFVRIKKEVARIIEANKIEIPNSNNINYICISTVQKVIECVHEWKNAMLCATRMPLKHQYNKQLSLTEQAIEIILWMK